ncbi:P-type cation-transporting ATPase [Chytridium lagenaria]|nr:P-type cation-transporting ATPase [Chytridium lagenaria]
MTFDDLMRRYNTSINLSRPLESRGMTEADASQRLLADGPNILTPPKKKSYIILYLECLSNIFNLLLIFCGIATYVLYAIDTVNNAANVYIGAILIGVAFINALIEFWQLLASEKILSGFLDLIPARCQVLRDGRLNQAMAANLVLVPADIVVFHSSDFKVDNSSLTGEADPQERVAHNTATNPLEATNLAFNGSLAVAGEAYGVVIRCGDSTVLGQIAGLTNNEHKGTSPLTQEINRFVAIIGTLSVLSALVFFIFAQVKTGLIGFSLNFAIGCLVAWVPQGLPATVTMLLTIAAKRMAKQNVLVKDLKGVETLGAITLLATDKTGTLTRNQMTASYFWTGFKLYVVAGNKVSTQDGEVAFDGRGPGVDEILHISAMCTRARFESSDGLVDQRTISGDATESGLFRFAAQKLSDIDVIHSSFRITQLIIFYLPFAFDAEIHDSGVHTLYMKGAPERLLRLCSTMLGPNGPVEITDAYRDDFNKSYEYMAGMGHRVLAFAELKLDGVKYGKGFEFSKEEKTTLPYAGFCFVGLASLEDPPKHGVREAIGHCREAGIKIMMVTGDHPLTAEAIGRKINLMLSDTRDRIAKKTNRRPVDVLESEVHAVVVHGETLDALTDDEWDTIFSKEEIIFARTSPKHKLQIVKRAQGLGHIVGVTGDGVNDSPALKKADLGIAMNISGSDVSKEAASMILMDDNFASTVTGIREGRLIFYNLKKSITYVITHITPEVIPFFLYAVVPLPIMISSLQILAVDLGFELIAALSFAWEVSESEASLMKVPPRRPVTPESIQRLRQRQADQAKDAMNAGLEDDTKSGLFFNMIGSLRMLFNAGWWKRALARPEGDILVDFNVLSYVYLEVGIIEYLGCLTAFFLTVYYSRDSSGDLYKVTPADVYQISSTVTNGFLSSANDFVTRSGRTLTGSDQATLLALGQSAFYFCLMIQQCFNLFYVLKNPATFVSAVTGALFAALIVYVPKVDANQCNVILFCFLFLFS